MDSDLSFNILTAAVLGLVVTLGPAAARAATNEACGLYSVPSEAGVQFTTSEHLGQTRMVRLTYNF